METSFDFSKLALDFKHYTRTKKRWDMNFQISVKIGNKTSMSKARAATECDGRSLERIVDVDVTEEMFAKLYRGNMIAVGPKMNSAPSSDDCHVSKAGSWSDTKRFLKGYRQYRKTRTVLGDLHLWQQNKTRENHTTSVSDSGGPRLLSWRGWTDLSVRASRPIQSPPAMR